MIFMQKFAVILCGLCLSASFLFSSVNFRMPNGEYLRGEIVEQNGDSIVFRSESFGLITLPASVLEQTEQAESPVPAQPAGPPISPSAVAGAPGERAQEAPPVGLVRQKLRLPSRFSANIMVGMDFLRSELDVDNYKVELNTGWKGEVHEFMTYHRYEYGKIMGHRTLDEYENAGRWIYPFHERWILLSQLSWLSDAVRLIDYEINSVVVPAYYFIRNDRTTLLAGIGAGHKWERFDVPDTRGDSYFNAVGYQLLRHRFSPRLNLEQTFLSYLSPEDTDKHSFLLELTLQRMLTDFLSINLRYSYGYDNNPAPEIDKVKERTTLMMGYQF